MEVDARLEGKWSVGVKHRPCVQTLKSIEQKPESTCSFGEFTRIILDVEVEASVDP